MTPLGIIELPGASRTGNNGCIAGEHGDNTVDCYLRQSDGIDSMADFLNARVEMLHKTRASALFIAR